MEIKYNLQTLYQKAIRFAGEKHGDQKMPSSKASYLVHLANVAMEVAVAADKTDEFDLAFAVQVALLHDVIEDSPTSYDEVKKSFSEPIADAVLALTKDENLPIEDQIPDSLKRIKTMPREVWAVKLADRISNMQKPPESWSSERKKKYREVAMLILKELKGGNDYLESRLALLIEEYQAFI
jgi:guanosine-3',5'-bis(diphosphate) 3'-pyrophosphohydrolase